MILLVLYGLCALFAAGNCTGRFLAPGQEYPKCPLESRIMLCVVLPALWPFYLYGYIMWDVLGGWEKDDDQR